MDNNANSNINNVDTSNSYRRPTISIKPIIKNESKTYTDREDIIQLLNDIAEFTNRSFNDVLKEIVHDFLNNGTIYDPENDAYYPIRDISKLLAKKRAEQSEDKNNQNDIISNE